MTETPLDGHEIHHRAARGAVLLAGRGILVRLAGFAGSLVLARLLVPEDFGLIAFGTMILGIGTFLAESGLGGGLIVREGPPSERELSALVGFQLAVTSAVAVVIAAPALLLGTSGQVIALMMVALPFYSPRSTAFLLFERRLDFRARVLVELLETGVYLAWAIAGAALGWGVWALASALVVRTAAGTLLAIRLSPLGWIAPTRDLAALKPLLSFGLRFQAVGGVNLLRDVALNTGVAAIAGFALLGLWGLALRVIAIPQLALEALWSVSFPAFARMRRDDHSMQVLLERSASTVSIFAALALAPIAASGPAFVPAVFGPNWLEAAYILPGAALALIVSAPLGICCLGYLYAVGEASRPLHGTLVGSAVRVACTLALVPRMGATAIGIGWAAATFAEMPILLRETYRRTGARIGRRIFVPATSASIAAGFGWLVCDWMGRSVLGGCLAVIIAIGGSCALIMLGDHRGLRDALQMSRRAAGVASRRRPLPMQPKYEPPPAS